MLIKTKSYRLEKKTYRRLAMRSLLKRQWWIGPIVACICAGYFWIPSLWWIFGAFLAGGLYILFWWIQFYGVTKLEQSQALFERFSYEISSRQLLLKISVREGMPISWDQVKRAEVGKDYFLIIINLAQLFHLPFRIFNSENERKFLQTVLRNKGLIR